MAQGSEGSSEFRIPDSELGGSVEFRVPNPESPHLQPVPSDMILLPRRTLHFEAALLLIVALVAFAAGYLIGGGRPADPTPADQAALNRVPVEGTITYDRDGKSPRGDEGAVVILLPAERTLPASLSVARTDPAGRFTLFAPAKGQYQLLAISANMVRPAGQSLGTEQAAAIRQYFPSAERLIGGAKFEWRAVEVSRGSPPIKIDFKP